MGNLLSDSVSNCIQNVYDPYISDPPYDQKEATKIDMMCNEADNLLGFSFFMIVFYGLLGTFMIYLTYRVKLLVWTEDKIIVFMLGLFCAHNWFSVLWYIVNIIGVLNYQLVKQTQRSYTCTFNYLY
jgi:hypothetical protein